MPKRVSQVSAVRTLTSSTPAASSMSSDVLVEHLATGTSTSCVSGCSTSMAVTRPEDAVAQRLSMTSPPSTSARRFMPFCVPQSSSVTTRSCVTSTRRRVR
jgi:hypothetical protein